MFFHFDPHYMLFVALPLLALTALVQLWVRSAFAKYSRVPNAGGFSGAEAALGILRAHGVHDVRVEPTRGWLSDHYDPRHKVLRLSPENYSGRSVAAVGIAAHEAGHALQHAARYAPLVLRNLAVPVASIGSGLGYLVIVIGMGMGAASHGSVLNAMTLVGLGLVASVAVFQLINLPVEFDASRRALAVLDSMGIATAAENDGVRRMLTAAAMTYVAATIAAVAEVVYWAWRLGLFNGRSND